MACNRREKFGWPARKWHVEPFFTPNRLVGSGCEIKEMGFELRWLIHVASLIVILSALKKLYRKYSLHDIYKQKYLGKTFEIFEKLRIQISHTNILEILDNIYYLNNHNAFQTLLPACNKILLYIAVQQTKDSPRDYRIRSKSRSRVLETLAQQTRIYIGSI